MKAMALVPAAVAAILALNINGAWSQAACGKEYQACMDSCASRPTKPAQDGCFQSCEGKNNFCAEKVYGRRPANVAPAVAAEPNGPAANANAMAKEKPQDAAPAQDAPKEQATEERPQEQPAAPKARQQTQRGPHRAPAKH